MINPTVRGPRAKDIWDIDLNPVRGHEQAGRERPAIVISGIVAANIILSYLSPLNFRILNTRIPLPRLQLMASNQTPGH